MSFFQDYFSKEDTIANWLSGIGSILVVLIALWPKIAKTFSKFLFPKIEFSVVIKGNIVVSQDGLVHKIQIPLEFNNSSFGQAYVESANVDIIDTNGRTTNLAWRNFITSFNNNMVFPTSTPRRFILESKTKERKFIEFLTEDDINISPGSIKLKVNVLISYFSTSKLITQNYFIDIDQKLIKQLQQAKNLASIQKRALVIETKINKEK